MFPKLEKAAWNHTCFRHAFTPAPHPITVERELRSICGQWQDVWNDRLARLAEGADAPDDPAPRTLAALITAHLRARTGELAPQTLERNRHYLNRWQEALGPDLDPARLDEPRLVAARQALLARLSPATINLSLAVLRTCLRWAIGRGYLASDPTTGLKALREPAPAADTPWWTTDEVAVALDCARQVDRDLAGRHGTCGHTAELLVALGCLLGLRYEEIVMLRWEDLDLDALHPETRRPEPVCRVRPNNGWSPKDGEARAIPIQADLAGILRRLRKPDGFVLEPKKRMPRRGGRLHTYRYDPQAIWNRIVAAVVARGGRRISPHGMRHSFASNLLIAGVSDVLVARWLGHADTGMLHQRYGHLRAYHGDIDRIRIP